MGAEKRRAEAQARLRVKLADPKHVVAYQDLIALVAKYKDSASAVELLAIAANMVGKLVALQDQHIITPSECMALIARNIEAGNQQVIRDLKNSPPEGTA